MREVLKGKIKSKIKKDDGLEDFLDDIIFDNKVIIRKICRKPKEGFSNVDFLMKEYSQDDFRGLYEKTDDELKSILKRFSIEIPVKGVGRNSKLEKIKHIKGFLEIFSISQENIWREDVYKISDLLPAVELFVSDYGLEADTKFKSVSVSEIAGFFKEETSDGNKRLSQIEKDIQKEMNLRALSSQSWFLFLKRFCIEQYFEIYSLCNSCVIVPRKSEEIGNL